MLECIPFLRIASLLLTQVAALAALLTSAINLVATPLPPLTAHDPSRPTPLSDIISLILHQLTVDEWAPKSAIPDCCLVSKSFLPLAREALYHTLHLTSTAQEWAHRRSDLPLQLANTVRRDCDLAINQNRLWKTLRCHPYLFALVCRLEVQMDQVEKNAAFEQASV